MIFLSKRDKINNLISHKSFFLKIRLKDLFLRNFFLGKEAFRLNKDVTKFFLGKRNNFFILNTEISLYSLKKGINLISCIFERNIASQAFFYFGYDETEYMILKKYLIKKTDINYVKEGEIEKFYNYLSPFPRQIYFLGKWKGGSISNFFAIITHVFSEVEKNLSLYKTYYPTQSVLSVFEYFANIYSEIFFGKLSKIFEKISNIKSGIKKKSTFFSEKDIKYVNSKKNIPYFLKTKASVGRVFFKKDNFCLLEGLPEVIITLSKNEALNFEASFMQIFNIGIIDPEKKVTEVDFLVPGNSSRALLAVYLKIFRSSIFLGRLQKIEKLFAEENEFFSKNKKISKDSNNNKVSSLVNFSKVEKLMLQFFSDYNS